MLPANVVTLFRNEDIPPSKKDIRQAKKDIAPRDLIICRSKAIKISRRLSAILVRAGRFQARAMVQTHWRVGKSNPDREPQENLRRFVPGLAADDAEPLLKTAASRGSAFVLFGRLGNTSLQLPKRWAINSPHICMNPETLRLGSTKAAPSTNTKIRMPLDKNLSFITHHH